MHAVLLTFALATAVTGCGDEYKRKRADRLAENGDFYKAAELYRELGELEMAATTLELGMDYYGAAMLFEQVEDWKRAAEAYEKGFDKNKAAELFDKAGELERAGDLRNELGDFNSALDLYQRGEVWAKAGLLLEQKGEFAEAAVAFEKGGDFSGFGRMLEKADKPIEAAAAYEKGKNYRAAAALYEAAEMWPEAARNAVALAERDSGTDAKLQAARTLGKSGEADRAAEFYDAALTQAKEFGNYATVMEVSVEAGKAVESMGWLLGETARLLDEGRAAVAAEALLALDAAPDDQFRKLKSGQKREFDALAERVIKAVEELPEIASIEGSNHFISYDGGVQTFEYCQIQGAVRNNGDQPFTRVEIEITLFKKDFDSFIAGQDGWGSIPDELTAKFEQQEAGYRETIEILDLQPGETREFTRKLGNAVPYKNFSDFVVKAEYAQAG